MGVVGVKTPAEILNHPQVFFFLPFTSKILAQNTHKNTHVARPLSSVVR